jgi:prophage regulatory protein
MEECRIPDAKSPATLTFGVALSPAWSCAGNPIYESDCPIPQKYWTMDILEGIMTEVADAAQEVRLLSNHNLAKKKPPAAVRLDHLDPPLPDLQDDLSFLRLPDVKRLTGLSKSTLYALIRAQNFPAPVQLAPRTVAWVRSEVKEWAAERISASRSTAPQSSDRQMPQRALGEVWTSSKRYA